MKSWGFVLVGGSAFLAACGSSDSGGGTHGSGGTASWDPSHPAACGLPAYSWRPASDVGGVLEKNVAQDATKTQLQTLLTVLASQAKVSHSLQYDVTLYVVRYQTQDKGQLAEATAMIGVPKVSGATTLPVLEFLHGTTGFDDACAPSLHATDNTKSMTVLALLYASVGYVSVFPDYIGLKSLGAKSPELLPYLIAEPTAIASLDAIRAAKKLVSDVASSITLGKVVVAGHSQGGHATEVTVRVAPTYAPELEVVAAAPLAAPTDLAGAMSAVLGASPVTLNGIALGVATADLMGKWYGVPSLSDVLVPPWDTQADEVVNGVCSAGYANPLLGTTDVNAVFQPALLEALKPGGKSLDPWSCYLSENSPTETPIPLSPVPTLYVLGEKDTLVFPDPERKAFESLCQRGAKLQYLECSGADHGNALAYSVDDVLDFFDARLKGDPMPADVCTVKPATKCKSTP